MSIVKNLKNFSRSGDDHSFETYNLNEGIQSTLIIAKNEFKYVAEVEQNLNELPPLLCDVNKINQVLLNLIVNAAQAIKKSEKTGGTIEISTWHDGNKVFCSISDNGCGIPDRIKSKIFEPFFTTKERGTGTGLGLSLSFDIIVHIHKGNLEVDSIEGKGSRFLITLPIAPESPGKGTDT